MKKVIILLLALLFLVSTLYSQDKVLNYQELNDKIFSHLEFLNGKGKSNRLLNGGIMIGLGLLSGIGGYVIFSTPSSDPELSQILGYGLIGFGTLYAGVGVPILLIPSKEEKTFKKFESYSDKDLKRKYEIGERDFRDLSDNRKMGRIVTGGAALALGVGSVLFTGSYYGAVLVGVGLAGILIDSPAEREWELYVEEKEYIIR
jgi:hypothetical protein